VLISNVIGGLGNQMFQYALGRAASLREADEFKLDIYDFEGYFREFELDVFNTQIKFATIDEVNNLKYREAGFLEGYWREIRKKGKPRSASFIKENGFGFDPRVLEIQSDAYFFGYWQSQNYFLGIRETLLAEFSPKNDLSKESELYIKKMDVGEAISIHIRRGDYIDDPSANKCHGTCDLSYYKKAVLEMERNVSNVHYFIFSDVMWFNESDHPR